MSKYIVDGADITSVADAIRNKTNVQGGAQSALVFPTGFVEAINGIGDGGDSPFFIGHIIFDNPMRCDKTYVELRGAQSNGQIVCLELAGLLLPISSLSASSPLTLACVVSEVGANGATLVRVSIDENDNVTTDLLEISGTLVAS